MYVSSKGLSRWRCLLFSGLLFVTVPISASSILTVTTVGNGIDGLTNLTGGNLNRTLVIITIDSQISQSPNGFRLAISSQKLGSLVRQPTPQTYADSGLDGNVAPYTFTLEPNGTGTLGCIEPILPIDRPLTTAITLDFSQQVQNDTVGKKYKCLFTIPVKTTLFAGTFGDQLTVTLSDL